MGAACVSETVTMRELLHGQGKGDHAFVTLIVAICFMHPFPMPGISMALALIIIVAGSRLTRGQTLWFPARLIDKPFRSRVPQRVFRGAAAAFHRLEWVFRPRARWLTSHRFSAQANGAAMVVCGLLILIPFPPPTNFPPATALLLISLGILEADGLLLGLGYLAVTATTLGFIALGILGWTGLKALLAG